jgi:hypothetical protein
MPVASALKFQLDHARAGPLYQSVNEARATIGRYLDFYNGRRPHSSLDDMTQSRQTLPLSKRKICSDNRGHLCLSNFETRRIGR